MQRYLKSSKLSPQSVRSEFIYSSTLKNTMISVRTFATAYALAASVLLCLAAAAVGHNKTSTPDSTLAVENGTASGRTYLNRHFGHHHFGRQPGGRYPQHGGRLPSAVGYFNNNNNNAAPLCSGKQAALPAACSRQLPQCSAQAQRRVCEEYVNNNLTETARVGAAPATYANMTWPSGAAALSGNLLQTAQLRELPNSISFPSNPYALYTIILQDVGESAAPASTRDIGLPVHYLVVNVPGNNFGAGDAVFEYFPALGAPPPFLNSPTLFNLFVYEQRARIVPDETRTPNCSFAGRSFFRAEKFAAKYNLIGPQYGNFFRVAPVDPRTDTTVPDAMRKCASYFPEQFRLAGLPYQIKGGLTMSWPNENIAGFGNVLRPAALGSEPPQSFVQSFDPTARYTMVLLDYDFNSPTTTTTTPARPYVNWLTINGRLRTLVTSGTHIIQYQRPAPPNDGRAHRFVGLVYLQPNGAMIDPSKFTVVQRCDTSPARAQFDLDAFVTANNLQPLDGLYTLMQYDGTKPC